jgi:carboxyl-terminal processing protease
MVDLTNTQKLYGLSLLWKEAHYNFANFDKVPELNLEEAYKEYLDLALESKSDYEYYRILQKFYALLKDGHTQVQFPDYIIDELSYPEIQLDSLGDKIIITGIKEQVEGITVGSEIIEVEGINTSEYLSKEVHPYISSSTGHYLWKMGAKYLPLVFRKSSICFKVRNSEGIVKYINLNTTRLTSDRIQYIFAQPPRIFEFKWLEDRIAYIAINTFSDISLIDEIKNSINNLKSCKGLIIDVRRNSGGNSAIALEVIKFFTDRPFWDTPWKTPKYIAAYKSWNKFNDLWLEGKKEIIYPTHNKIIDVPIVVLTSNLTYSSAENFLVSLASINLATFVGERTAGSSGNPLMFELPRGGLAQVCTKREWCTNGHEFIGCGIEPHICVEQTLEDIIGKTDSILKKGLEVLKQKISITN